MEDLDHRHNHIMLTVTKSLCLSYPDKTKVVMVYCLCNV